MSYSLFNRQVLLSLTAVVITLIPFPTIAQPLLPEHHHFAQTQPRTPPTPPPADLRPPLPATPTAPDTPPPTPSDTPLIRPSPESPPESLPPPDSDTITVKQFNFVGNTAFSDEQLAEQLQPYTNTPLSFAQLLQARSVITELYTQAGYITSGAFIPGDQQRFSGDGAEITIRIVEGTVEDIRITGTQRLKPSYVRSRLRQATTKPLQEQRLIDALQLLELDPLIQTLSAELAAGSRPGTNNLDVQVIEADAFSSQVSLNNSRSPSVGSFRRGADLTHANLLGLGDSLSVSYNNTDGSDNFDLRYTLPVNPRNGTISLNYSTTSSQVIESPFDELDIESDSRYYQLTLRQPIIQTPTQEFALSLTAAHTDTETTLLDVPFPLSPGADEQGETTISALRFSQEWTQRNRNHVFAIRSQFSLGIDAFDATIQDDAPDSRFFAWRGQAQWVRLLGTRTSNSLAVPTVVLRGDMQLADQPLVPTEQLGLGGFGSIRGYRQDALLTDNGILASGEIRLPVVRIPEWETVVQLIPFIDLGVGWNSGDTEEPETNTLAAIGLGLQLLQSRGFSARLDWGIPLVNLESTERTWQENGIYFSVEYNPF
jgi:hemolysin activation/secretion protein